MRAGEFQAWQRQMIRKEEGEEEEEEKGKGKKKKGKGKGEGGAVEGGG